MPKSSSTYDNLLANVPTDLWIGGKWRKSSDGARFDITDPATEEKICDVASATVEDAKAAVDAAQASMADWAGRKPRERAEILRKAYELIIADAERLAKLITLENGKALSDSRGEVAYSAEFFRWYAEEGVRNIGQMSVAPSSGARILVQHKPIGVAVLVTPWNFPAAMATRKIGPGARCRLSGRAEARVRDAADHARADADPGEGGRAGRRRQRDPVAPLRPGGQRHAARPARAHRLVHRLDRGRPQAAARGGRQHRQAGDGARRQRAVPGVRGRRHRCRDRGRDDRQDAQHGRGVHGGEPLLRAREGRRRVREEADRQDGRAQDGQRARPTAWRSARSSTPRRATRCRSWSTTR